MMQYTQERDPFKVPTVLSRGLEQPHPSELDEETRSAAILEVKKAIAAEGRMDVFYYDRILLDLERAMKHSPYRFLGMHKKDWDMNMEKMLSRGDMWSNYGSG